MKKQILIFFGLLFLSLGASAQDYGFIRVRVLGVPVLSHNAPVSLYSNGKNIGSSFSHSVVGFDWVPLSIENLSSTSERTPIEVRLDKTQFAVKQCSFRFEIQFSFDREGKGAFSIGSFDAPSGRGGASIPISTRCPGRMKVCSDAPGLKEKLDRNYKASLVENYRREKRAYDQRLRERYANQQKDLDRSLTSLEKSPLPDFEKGQRELQKMIDEYTPEFERVVEEAKVQDNAMTTNQASNPLSPLEIQDFDFVQDAVTKAQDQIRAEAIDDLKKDFSGEVLMGVIEFDRNSTQIIKDQEFLLRQDEQDGVLIAGDKARLEAQKQALDFVRREILRLETTEKYANAAAKGAIKKIPYLGAAITWCEVVTGKEMCIGRVLDLNERIDLACKWTYKKLRISEKVSKAVLSDLPPQAQKEITKRIERGTCDQFKSY